MKKISMIIFGIIGVLLCVVIIYSSFKRKQINNFETMSVDDCIKYTTEKDSNIVITTGYLKGGKITWHVYGQNAKELPQKEYVYEIGSVTKTITCSILCKAISEGKINLDDPITKYIEIPNAEEDQHFPTVRELATHTAGYGHILHSPLIKNSFKQINPFYGYSNVDLLKTVAEKKLKDKDYSWEYSNFGMSLLGTILGHVYNTSYKKLAQDFILNDLGLKNTFVNSQIQQSGFKFWEWKDDDAYLAAGSICSTITDMLSYAKLHIESENENDSRHYLAQGHKSATQIKSRYQNTVHIDGMGLGWVLDTHNNYVWHNGGTSWQNSYLAFSNDTKTAVVVLSNAAPFYRIPATIIGAKMMNDLRK